MCNLTTTVEEMPTDYLDLDAVNRQFPRGVVLSQQVRESCAAIAQLSDITVLIHGESGTGKGVVAREIADLRRRDGNDIPFVSLNCAVLNTDLADSVIFGHRRGAFTGAYESADGAVGEANGGILFLDELHCLSINTQRKLLKLLDGGAYSRVGESSERQARFQLIAASNQDLHKLVMRGEFLFDIFMRIQGVEISLPPLRERMHELPDIVRGYFAKFGIPIRNHDLNQLVNQCKPLYWPGNIRQLYKAFDTMRFVARVSGSDQYAPYFAVTQTMQKPRTEPAGPESAVESGDAVIASQDFAEPINTAVREIFQVRDRRVNLTTLMESVEASLIQYALSRNDSISGVMEHLGISRGVLDFKRRKYNLMKTRTAMQSGFEQRDE
jgi:DNA-binding NtrC family response regulator